jgi:hypothetical protein
MLTEGNTADGDSYEEVEKVPQSLYKPTGEVAGLVKDGTPVWSEGPVTCPPLSLATCIIEGIKI